MKRILVLFLAISTTQTFAADCYDSIDSLYVVVQKMGQEQGKFGTSNYSAEIVLDLEEKSIKAYNVVKKNCRSAERNTYRVSGQIWPR